MLCPRCNLVFNRKAAKNLEGVRLAKKGRNWRDPRSNQALDGRWDPRRGNQKVLPLQANRPSTYRPTADALRCRWMKQVERRGQGYQKWKNFEVERGSLIVNMMSHYMLKRFGKDTPTQGPTIWFCRTMKEKSEQQ